MTHIFTPDPEQKAKWKQQAMQAASHLKRMTIDKSEIQIGFAFDDGFVTLTVQADWIKFQSEDELAMRIYSLVLKASKESK